MHDKVDKVKRKRGEIDQGKQVESESRGLNPEKFGKVESWQAETEQPRKRTVIPVGCQ